MLFVMIFVYKFFLSFGKTIQKVITVVIITFV